MKNKPFRYSEWIKHAYDFEEGVSPVEIVEHEVFVIAHPAHPKIRLNLRENIVSQIYALPKSLQLYFFGLVWVGFCKPEKNDEWITVKRILLSVFDYAKENPNIHKKEMIWDDHALSERACVLIFLKESLVDEDIVYDIDDHLKDTVTNLNIILSSEKWKGNNHRIFHLCAKWCVENYLFKNSESAQGWLLEIEEYFLRLIDVETGLSIEQSVSYYNFDIILLKLVSHFLTASGKRFNDTRLDLIKIENRKNNHIKALAFPDGKLPASGDTPLGTNIPSPNLTIIKRNKFWKNLERMGHFRGCSENERFHYHILKHNAEAAHGHHSPLHVDLWCDELGMVLVDSGGPYKYGDPLRYSWFRDSSGHNTVSSLSATTTTEYSVEVESHGRTLRGLYNTGGLEFLRETHVGNKSFNIIDNVKAENDWFTSLHFHPELKVERKHDIFIIKKGQNEIILKVTNSANTEVKQKVGCVTSRSGAKEKTSSVVVFGAPGQHTVQTTFSIIKN